MHKNQNQIGGKSVQFPTLHPAQFIKRENRFLVKIQLGENTTFAHLANPGRLYELLIPGADIWVSEALNPRRSTNFSLELVRKNDTLVSLNSQIPNRLIDNALAVHSMPNILDYTSYRREAMLEHSRIDFCITHGNSLNWLEIKSVTLVKNGVATFPDAPTLRGQRHLAALIAATQNGNESTVAFVIQRSDAHVFTPNDKTDPEFSRLLRYADKVGTKILAINCTVTHKEICLNQIMPVSL